ncbi:MAG TPA: SusC/RagA family TonB-linked outer membrane protein, partial [Fibrella sp.]
MTGKVTEAGGIGLPGVTVQIKGMTRGTNTDGDGSFRLTDVPAGATLIFSSIGYVSQEVAVGNRSSVNVSMAEDSKSLSEVVVTGYGTQKAKDATGGVVALGTKDFNKGVITSPEQLLQGRAAGIQVTPASGEPGAGVNIQIRGTSSVRSNNNPLFVIDGVPLSGDDVSSGGFDVGAGSTSARNPLNFLNPNDIENISVLKDASAAAIYGSRGANGVVLITTKRGKSGQQTLNFSSNVSVSSAARRYDLLSAEAFKAGLTKAGGTLDATTNGGATTDWQDAILRTAITHNQNLSFGGGNDNTRYFFSLGYQDQQGIIKTSSLQRTTARVNASHELFNDKVVLDLSLTTSGIRNRYVANGDNAGAQGSLIGAALQSNPTYPIYGGFLGNTANETAGFFTPGGDFRNPVAILNLINDRDAVSRTLGSLSATWRITDALSAKANFGIDNAASTRWTNIDKRLAGFNDTYAALASTPGGRAVIQNQAN